MPDASHDFGAHLRQAREQRGVSLREIADRTKIAVLALEALERNDISRLPGGIFTRAFVRSYASEVGLDPEDAVRRFLARFPDQSSGESALYEPNAEHISVDEPPTFGRAWRAVAWSVPLLLVVGYFGFGGRLPWWGDATTPQPAARATNLPKAPPPPAVAAPTPPAPAPPGDVAAGSTAESAASSSTPELSPSTAAQRAVAPSRSEPVSATTGGQTTVPPSAAVPAAAQDASAPGTFRLTLAPREACWVSVRSKGASVYSGLMRPGERQNLVLRGDVSLTVGNAGAFVYLINDQPGRSLGGPGQVTTVRLNADNAATFIEPR